MCIMWGVSLSSSPGMNAQRPIAATQDTSMSITCSCAGSQKVDVLSMAFSRQFRHVADNYREPGRRYGFVENTPHADLECMINFKSACDVDHLLG